jgi:hypothetical protein
MRRRKLFTIPEMLLVTADQVIESKSVSPNRWLPKIVPSGTVLSLVLRCIILSGRMSGLGQNEPPSFVAAATGAPQ